jgi:antitoxin HigA-1
MMNMHNPPHPGVILWEMYLEPLGLTVTDAAKALDITRQTLSELIHGKRGVSIEMAMRLAKAFSTTPERWLKLQMQYDLWINRGKKLSKVSCFLDKEHITMSNDRSAATHTQSR